MPVTKVTLHYRDPAAKSLNCAVCGARLTFGALHRWWLRNTWTDKREHYTEGQGCWPGDWFVPCGKLGEDSPPATAQAGERVG